MPRQAPVHFAEPDYAIPPGETLHDRLEEMGMSQAELSRRAGLTTKHVNQVIHGVATLSPDVALKLEYVTGVPVRLWLRLEADYRSAQQRLFPAASESDLAWVSMMPVRNMVKAGALPDHPSDKPNRFQQLLTFFGVASVDAYRSLRATTPAPAFRQSAAHPVNPDAVAAWLRLGELAAQSAPAADVDLNGLREWTTHIRTLTRLGIREALTELVDASARFGVVIVFIPEVQGARAYGVTRWLAGKRPLIQLSLRGRTDDQLWETVAHEFGHLLLHDRKTTFVEIDSDHGDNAQAGEYAQRTSPGLSSTTGSVDLLAAQEAQARRFARTTLITPNEEAQLSRMTTIDDVVAFAEHIEVANGIAAARMEQLGLWSRSYGFHLKRTVGDIDLPGQPARLVDDRAARRAKRRLPGDALGERDD